jgi:hypothetical protein
MNLQIKYKEKIISLVIRPDDTLKMLKKQLELECNIFHKKS